MTDRPEESVVGILCVPDVCVPEEPCPSSNVTLWPFPPRHVQVTVDPAAIGEGAGAKKFSHTLTDVGIADFRFHRIAGRNCIGPWD